MISNNRIAVKILILACTSFLNQACEYREKPETGSRHLRPLFAFKAHIKVGAQIMQMQNKVMQTLSSSVNCMYCTSIGSDCRPFGRSHLWCT